MKKKDWDVAEIMRQLNAIHRQINNRYNDGFTSAGCKQDLYQIKCHIDDLYQTTPTFTVEEEWHQQRLVDLLKK
jgi:hypothetical protein